MMTILDEIRAARVLMIQDGQRIEYRWMGRKRFPDGIAMDEPDKVQWVDAVSGLDCLIVRHPRHGAWCGYVGVPERHPWYETGYDTCTVDGYCASYTEWGFCEHTPDKVISVHGGITYSEHATEEIPEHAGISHIPFPGRPERLWWFGFDCVHSHDLPPIWAYRHPALYAGDVYRDQEYVTGEVRRLAAQLSAIRPDVPALLPPERE
jgi:hypothetical protein